MRQRCSHREVIVLLNACKSIHLVSQHLIRDQRSTANIPLLVRLPTCLARLPVMVGC